MSIIKFHTAFVEFLEHLGKICARLSLHDKKFRLIASGNLLSLICIILL